mgnify:CR=1 FL=1
MLAISKAFGNALLSASNLAGVYSDKSSLSQIATSHQGSMSNMTWVDDYTFLSSAALHHTEPSTPPTSSLS